MDHKKFQWNLVEFLWNIVEFGGIPVDSTGIHGGVSITRGNSMESLDKVF